MNEIVVMEVTKEEVQMIMEERKKAERLARREVYVNELNDLIQRAKAEGFIIAAYRSFKSCESVGYAMCWNDTKGNFIGLR